MLSSPLYIMPSNLVTDSTLSIDQHQADIIFPKTFKLILFQLNIHPNLMTSPPLSEFGIPPFRPQLPRCHHPACLFSTALSQISWHCEWSRGTSYTFTLKTHTRKRPLETFRAELNEQPVHLRAADL